MKSLLNSQRRKKNWTGSWRLIWNCTLGLFVPDVDDCEELIDIFVCKILSQTQFFKTAQSKKHLVSSNIIIQSQEPNPLSIYWTIIEFQVVDFFCFADLIYPQFFKFELGSASNSWFIMKFNRFDGSICIFLSVANGYVNLAQRNSREDSSKFPQAINCQKNREQPFLKG